MTLPQDYRLASGVNVNRGRNYVWTQYGKPCLVTPLETFQSLRQLAGLYY